MKEGIWTHVDVGKTPPKVVNAQMWTRTQDRGWWLHILIFLQVKHIHIFPV